MWLSLLNAVVMVSKYTYTSEKKEFIYCHIPKTILLDYCFFTNSALWAELV